MPNMSARRLGPTNPFIEFKKEDIEGSIPARFEQMVEKYPNRLAVKTHHQETTYRDLNHSANRMARGILDCLGEGEERVALLLEREVSGFAAILGALKSGKTYVPIDPSYPDERNSYILENSQASLIVTDQANLVQVKELAGDGVPVLIADEIDGSFSEDNLNLSISPDTLAWILYTSGSTGNPKGVMQTQRNMLHMAMNYTNYFHIHAEDRLTLFYSMSFNASNKDMYGAFLNGATLFPFDLKKEGINPLARWLIENEITIYHSSATAFRQFASNLTGTEEFPHLRIIYPADEAIYRTDFDLFRKHFSSDCLFVNGLGATETPQFRWFFANKKTPVKTSYVPIGYPLNDMESMLVDEEGNEVEAGGVGEIAVRSPYISPGYWRLPDRTQAAFLPDPEGGDKRIYRMGDLGQILSDGNMVCLGRKDFQIKVRGHRIEVAEIEMGLGELIEVKDAVVQPFAEDTGDSRIVAYIVPENGSLLTTSSLRRALLKKLPEYMIPSAFIVLDDLPLTESGKVNRRVLPEPGNRRPNLDQAFVAARTSIEEELEGIWSDLLGLNQVGIHDPFLELGGDSLKATKLISQVLEKFQVEMPMKALMDAPTIAEMAEAILHHRANQLELPEMERLLDEVESSSENE